MDPVCNAVVGGLIVTAIAIVCQIIGIKFE